VTPKCKAKIKIIKIKRCFCLLNFVDLYQRFSYNVPKAFLSMPIGCILERLRQKAYTMFSKSCKYAIRAVLHLAAFTAEERKLGVQSLADSLEVPKHFLGKILQELSRQGIVSSAKGPTGGFFLSDADRQAPLSRVVEAIDGPEVFSSCILGLPVCGADNPCPLHFQALEYREALQEIIEDRSIAQVVEGALEKDLKL
jgi:Rrf2 family protein